jgi:capsular exopolysaccharide synthesis family protein
MSAAEQQIVPYVLRRTPDRPLPSDPPPASGGGMLQEAWGVVVRRWRLIASLVIALVGATGLYCLVTTPYYRARATVLIEARGPQVTNGSRFGDPNDVSNPKYDYYQTQFKLLQSGSLARRVIQDLELIGKPGLEASSEAGVTSLYLRQLTILPVRSTRLVMVEFLSPDAQLAADVANAHARLFVKTDLERIYSSMDQVRGFLQSKLAGLQAEMQNAELKLSKFQSEHSLLPVDLSKDVASERLMDLSRRLSAAEADRIALEAQYTLIKNRDYDGLPAVLASPMVQKLRDEQHRLELEYSLMAQKFRASYPPLRQLGAQLDRARELLHRETSQVVAGIEANYLTAQRTAQQLKSEMDQQRKSLLERKDAEGELLTLAREAETTRSLYNNLLARLKDLDVAVGADTSNMSVAEPAATPRRPYWPNVPVALALSLTTSLLLGVGLAFVLDSAESTVRDSRDVLRTTGLATLAVVPDFSGAASLGRRLTGRRSAATPPILLGNGNGNGHGQDPLQAEAYRTLRTSLLLSAAPQAPRVLVVTSPMGSEGKTTTAVNTAAALASCGTPVLLIDGDLRLPRCHAALGRPAEPGLAEYLAARVPEAPIQRTDVDNLFLLPAGRIPRNPGELLTSWRMSKLLRDARERFAFVVIDSPPVLVVSDGLLLANLADGVIVVAESRRSRQEQVRVALERLHAVGATPLGVVLNRGAVDTSYYRYYSGVPGEDYAATDVAPNDGSEV